MIIYDRKEDNFMLATVDMNSPDVLFVEEVATGNPDDKKHGSIEISRLG